MARDGLTQCLDGKVNAGRLTRKQAEEVARDVRDQEERLARYRSRTEAEREAERTLRGRLEERAKVREREQAKHLLAVKRAITDSEAHPDGFNTGVRGHLDIVRHATSANVTSRANSLRGMFHAVFADGIFSLRPRLIGLIQKRSTMRNFLRATFKEEVSDADARTWSQAWHETTELTRELANRAGADVRFRVDWHVPQREDPARLRSAGFQGWREHVMRRGVLARDRILDPETGAPMSDLELEAVLPQIFEAKMTRGLSEIVPGADPAMAPPVRKLDHQRFMQFATSDAWLDYHGAFGRGSVFGVLMGHLDFMAREIALLQILGPKHNQLMRQMLDRARMEEPRRHRRRLRGTTVLDRPPYLDAMYRKHTGALDRLDDADLPGLIKAFEATRAYLAAFQLGSAVFSAVSDLKTFSRTASWNGLTRWRAFAELLAQINPADATHRKWAVRRGLIAENASTVAFSANRFQDRVQEGGFGSWLAQLTTTATGLNGYTQASRHAFGLEFMATLTEHAELRFDDLPDPLRQAFVRHRLSEQDWDVIRSSPRIEPEEGADFLDPLQILRREDTPRDQALDVSTRLLDMINEEKDRAVITSRPTSEVVAVFRSERGSFAGQLMRSFGMYKNFTITWTLLHGQRAREVGGVAGARYMADLFIGMTLLGAVGMSLRDISKGRDPRDWTDPKFWMAASFQGGGLGIFGDFIYSLERSRFGHGIATTLTGPVGGLLNEAARLGPGNIKNLLKGEETHFADEAVGFLRDHNPGASLWYARTVLDRLVWDQLQEEVDPDYRASFRRMERFWQDEFGQDFFWAPGQVAPERAPNVGAIAGED